MSKEVTVWDPLIRVFHWSLVAGFTVAYLSGEGWGALHVIAGYIVLGLVGFRLVWGLIGPGYARFSGSFYSPLTTIAYLKELKQFRAARYLGHNPAGAAMIFMLLFLLLGTSVSGLAYYGAEDHAGPLASSFSGVSEATMGMLEEVHEVFANITLLAVILHIAGVVFSSFLHNENLPRAMVTGRKKREPIAVDDLTGKD